jgi:hypothetical protein
MADITEIDEQVAQDEESVAIPIYQKNGDPYLARDGSPSTISVTGTDAKRYVAMVTTIQRRMLRRRQTKMEPADLLKNRIDLASAGVTGWHGWESGDQDFPPTPENITALLGKAHILVQVERGIEGHADFFTPKAP